MDEWKAAELNRITGVPCSEDAGDVEAEDAGLGVVPRTKGGCRSEEEEEAGGRSVCCVSVMNVLEQEQVGRSRDGVDGIAAEHEATEARA